MGQLGTPETGYSRRLPPPEAWKRPDKWIDLSTGLAKPTISKLMLPVDDRGFIRPDEVVEVVEDLLFWKDYDWPFDPTDQETAPDDHHFYYERSNYVPLANKGSRIPLRFRELPTNIGRMPRQFHNAIHDFTLEPAMPDGIAMEEYTDAYLLAHQAFSNLIKSAKRTRQASRMFSLREAAIQAGTVVPLESDDLIARELMREFFAKHFSAYSISAERVKNLPAKQLVLRDNPDFDIRSPRVVAQVMSRYVLKGSINFTPFIQAA